MSYFDQHGITGTIIFTRHYDTDTVTAEWEGGPRVMVSHELMGEADSRFWQFDGETLKACQFTLRLVGRTEIGDYILERQ